MLDAKAGGYTVGVLVQCNYGAAISCALPESTWAAKFPNTPSAGRRRSIIVVVATDAPLIPTQLKRIARKLALGLGRDGSYSGNGSGDIFIAFSTANPGAVGTKGLHQLTMLPNDSLDPIFLATVQATEEAVVNAMVAAETMTGIDNHTVIALPHDRLREVLKKYNRLAKVIMVGSTGLTSFRRQIYPLRDPYDSGSAPVIVCDLNSESLEHRLQRRALHSQAGWPRPQTPDSTPLVSRSTRTMCSRSTP